MAVDRRELAKAANDAIADEIRACRVRRGWQRPDLARAAGIPEVTLERYENAKRDIPLTAFIAIASALETTAEEIVVDARSHNPEAFKLLESHEGMVLGEETEELPTGSGDDAGTTAGVEDEEGGGSHPDSGPA